MDHIILELEPETFDVGARAADKNVRCLDLKGPKA